MISRGAEQIRCEIIPIPGGLDVSKHALFFHRFQEQVTDSVLCTGIPSCSVHRENLAAVQCKDCVKFGLPVRQSYHCSQKCFQGAWKKHLLNHLCAAKDQSFDSDVKLGKLRRRSHWPPADIVSWFDERVEVVCPGGRNWVSKLGFPNIFVPVADDVGFSFKLGSVIPDNFQVAVPVEDVLVTDPVIQRLNLSHRRVLQLPDSNKSEMFGITKQVSKIGSFNVLTYNMLSDIYAHPEKYFYCPQWALSWEYRQKNLLHEVLLYDADILCLQEVQSDHFENFFKPQLITYGYSAIYKKKTNEVYTGNGYTSEGCAIFFRNHVFKEVVSYELEYSKTALPLIEKLEPSQRDEAKIRLIKDNVALAVILEMVEDTSLDTASWSRLCVVTTHIYASKSFPDVKLLQVSDLINEIENIIDERIPLLICGDFNSIPESDPYILLANRKMNPTHVEEAIDPLGIYQHLKLHHSIKLASTYPSAFFKLGNNTDGDRMIMINQRTGEPSFTSLTLNRRTLDYIFYTEDSLEVEGLLQLPDCDSVGRALPSPLWSSDHIALMGRFRITRPFLG